VVFRSRKDERGDTLERSGRRRCALRSFPESRVEARVLEVGNEQRASDRDDLGRVRGIPESAREIDTDRAVSVG
jgi:hypothetical protein